MLVGGGVRWGGGERGLLTGLTGLIYGWIRIRDSKKFFGHWDLTD